MVEGSCVMMTKSVEQVKAANKNYRKKTIILDDQYHIYFQNCVIYSIFQNYLARTNQRFSQLQS